MIKYPLKKIGEYFCVVTASLDAITEHFLDAAGSTTARTGKYPIGKPGNARKWSSQGALPSAMLLKHFFASRPITFQVCWVAVDYKWDCRMRIRLCVSLPFPICLFVVFSPCSPALTINRTSTNPFSLCAPVPRFKGRLQQTLLATKNTKNEQGEMVLAEGKVADCSKLLAGG